MTYQITKCDAQGQVIFQGTTSPDLNESYRVLECLNGIDYAYLDISGQYWILTELP